MVEPPAGGDVLLRDPTSIVMRCTEFLQIYSDYRDGRLSDDGVAFAAERHLVECARCARYDQAVRRGVNVLRTAPEIEPSPAFRHTLRRRLLGVTPPDPFPATGRVAASVLVAAAVALLVLEGVSLMPDAEAPAESNAQVVVNPGPPFVGFADPGAVRVIAVTVTDETDADSAARTAAVAP